MFERIRQLVKRRSEPDREPVGAALFTATSLPTSSSPPDREEPLFESAPAARTREPDLWDDEPLVGPHEPDPLESEDDDVSIESLTDELSRLAAEEAPADAPLPEEEPGAPVEPLFASRERPPARTARSPGEAAADLHLERPEYDHVSVHGERLDVRPGPIRMTPSEALALAKEGPAALRRRRRPS